MALLRLEITLPFMVLVSTLSTLSRIRASEIKLIAVEAFGLIYFSPPKPLFYFFEALISAKELRPTLLGYTNFSSVCVCTKHKHNARKIVMLVFKAVVLILRLVILC